MKILLCVSACFLLIAGLLYAQDGVYGMIGNYSDIALVSQGQQPYGFTFARLIYNGKFQGTPRNSKNWYTDFPSGDRTAVEVLRRITSIDVAPFWRAIPINNSDLFSYPFLYVSEPSQMALAEADADRLREYLARGGFLMFDDLWGTAEWEQFEKSIRQIFPDRLILSDLPVEHTIFNTVFDIEEIMRTPHVSRSCATCTQWEYDGEVPYVRGIFDDRGHLYAVILFNTDTMDALENSDHPQYALKFGSYAYKIFVNTIVYALTR